MCLSLCVRVVNVCVCWSVGNGVSVNETLKQRRVSLLWSDFRQQVVLSRLLSRHCIYESAIHFMIDVLLMLDVFSQPESF